MPEQELLQSKLVGAKKASERSRENLQNRLEAQGLKLPLYPTPQVIDRARTVMGSIDFDPTSGPVKQVLVEAATVAAYELNPYDAQGSGKEVV